MNQLVEKFKKAWTRRMPLVLIVTPDPAHTLKILNDNWEEIAGKQPAMITWDVARGWRGMNKDGEARVSQLCADDPVSATSNPSECLMLAMKLSRGDILFTQNMHMFLENELVIQAAWNLRDPFKTDNRMLVMLNNSPVLPPELMNDVIIIDQELPNDGELFDMVCRGYRSARQEEPDGSEEEVERAIAALTGLPPFAAEQGVMMSMEKTDGEGKSSARINPESAWEFKRHMINAAPGLSVWRGGETFADIGGIVNAKKFLTSIVMHGERRPSVIGFMDEIEKSIGGGVGTSDVQASLLGTLLSEMQDNEWTGLIAIGPPGAAKSAAAKAAGNTAGIPTISIDLPGMKGSLVGQSEQNMRDAMKTLKAVGGKKVVFIATCNSIASLPPELRRRFGLGTMFFDLPDDEERESIWQIYINKYNIKPQKGEKTIVRPDDKGWTGAEIKMCCELASIRLGCSLVEAAAYIVPVAISAGKQIERLRTEASGRFISASYPGIYKHNGPIPLATGERDNINLDK